MTVFEAISDTEQQLQGIYDAAEAAAITDWLAEAMTHTRKTERQLRQELELSVAQAEQWEAAVARLLQHEPLQYVLNEAWFYGLKFYVDKNVLIPRPETEELLDWIIENHSQSGPLHILDIGTGSGCIPISLKKTLPQAQVRGIDISAAALGIATRNATALHADVDFSVIDFLDTGSTASLPVFDIIVSNPPYIPQLHARDMDANVLRYEPATALFVPDDDPIVFYKAIAHFGKEHLNSNGSIYLELYDVYHTEVNDFYTALGYQTVILQDMQGKQRMLKASLPS
ncbi:peptide chain release factor N(5)-glutamine methyltransferase [Terrimonas rubra]|uniref:peptide chain release factor N(5)-glutamine methyltransferase n=1 Tax=Terrimonas rubra TaxID=1035890 RepID=A0ABW6AA07_9BACT